MEFCVEAISFHLEVNKFGGGNSVLRHVKNTLILLLIEFVSYFLVYLWIFVCAVFGNSTARLSLRLNGANPCS